MAQVSRSDPWGLTATLPHGNIWRLMNPESPTTSTFGISPKVSHPDSQFVYFVSSRKACAICFPEMTPIFRCEEKAGCSKQASWLQRTESVGSDDHEPLVLVSHGEWREQRTARRHLAEPPEPCHQQTLGPWRKLCQLHP